MRYQEFKQEYFQKDYILIKMSGHYPFFVEKIIQNDGKKMTDRRFHIDKEADSCYINFEMPDDGISAEITMCSIFNVTKHYDCPVFVLNVGNDPFYAGSLNIEYGGKIEPGEVLGIYHDSIVRETDCIFEER